MTEKNVFRLWQSMEDYNQTAVYGGLNEAIDWGIFYSIADGTKSLDEYEPLQ